MLFFKVLLAFVLGLCITATPTTPHPDLSHGPAVKSLDPRQILEADPYVNCCQNCVRKYSYDTFYNVFNNFCSWAGAGMELWTSQTYTTGSYYCKPGSPHCIHLLIQFLGGGSGSAVNVDYNGCIGYFMYAIYPRDVCGGGPYPGAHIESPDLQWIFQATADAPETSTIADEDLLCENGPWYRLANPNVTLPTHTFG